MDQQGRWPDLLPDLLRQISGRLHHAIDFVRFHAVCRPWRNSHDATATAKATTQHFLPWLVTTVRTKQFWNLEPDEKHYDELSFTCVFSKTSYNALHVPAYVKWVSNADGTAIRYFGDHPYCTLHQPFTAATTLVPTVPDYNDKRKYKRPRGIFYHDGTTLLFNHYRFFDEDDDDRRATLFSAALLRPGDAAWTTIERTLEGFEYGNCCVAYHGSKIVVSSEGSRWHVVTPNDDVATDMVIPSPWTPIEREKYYYFSGHIMESRGELLWASLHIKHNSTLWTPMEGVCDLVEALLLSVYAFQEEVSTPKKMRWVRKDSKSLADRVMFLGMYNSFAVDASRLRGGGGCAYFVYSGGESDLFEWSAVLRYNLIDNKAEFVHWLPKEWHDDNCEWLIPQPTIAPIH